MNTRNIVLLNILLWIFFFNHERLIEAQSILSQSIKGKVVEKETQNPIEGAIVMIPNTNHAIATTTDSLGNFCLKNVEIGRHDILINMLGYEPYVVREILVTSGKEVVINAELTEKINQIAELVVKAEKGKPTNSMAMVSSRQFNIEEASRYAGGYNDPSRLASSFAGVAGSLSTNAIVIRGNSPKGLLWRMENTDIPNPSHFSDVSVVGAGALTALSSQMLSNSDFYTGAFPAEFGNALSGVFDIKLRNGNNYKNENTIQLGIIGTDISSEGPFGKNNNSSYLFNYRYSTLSLLSPILPPEMGILRYQDFAFKVNVHSTDGKNNLSIWGLGTLDYQHHPAVKDSFDWNSDYDKTDFFVDAYMGVIGINYRIHHGQKTFSNISISSVTQKLVYDKKEIDKTYYLNPLSHLENKNWRYSLSYTIQHKFNARITNRTGITINRLYYQIGSEKTENINKKNTYISGNGNGNLIQLFTQSKYNLSDKIKVTAGIYSQYFELNNEISFEPRIATKYDVNNKFYIAFSYGRHSQIEPLYIYYTTIEENGKYIYPNKKIKFSYSDHYVLSFNYKINSNLALKIEPYYQKLDNIPVVPNSYISVINLENYFFFNNILINKGKGTNIGIDLTFERYLNKGFYYLFTSSIFDSKYTGGDNILRNTKYNRNYIINLLGGKEWYFKNNSILSINSKFCIMGGDYYTPLNIEETIKQKEIVYDETQPFSKRNPSANVLSFSILYKINRPKHSSSIEFSMINVLGYKEINGYYFDKVSNTPKQDVNQFVIPNISYKIDF